ncbi:hypothetical protein OQA88_9042 [Cercophora sp. LCS_1]
MYSESSQDQTEERHNLLGPDASPRPKYWKTYPSLWLRTFRRSPFAKPLIYLVIVLLLVLVLNPFVNPSYTTLPAHYHQLRQGCEDTNYAPGCANPNSEKVFLAAILYDKDGKLASGIWGERILSLISLLGPSNVYLSIYENDSGPEGKAALEHFKTRVPCANHIVFDETVTPSSFPNITLPDGSQRIKRTAYLADLRNRALQPLDALTDVPQFDKVLYLNDVSFNPLDAAHLLFNTNLDPDTGRASYVAACATDFWKHFRLYDIYALRDAEGFADYQSLFPFFPNRGNAVSRKAVLQQSDAVRVKSCWGGMMAMQAKYVQNMERSLPSEGWRDISTHVINPDNPRNVSAPVRFRFEPDVYYDACECCLFPADLETVARRSGDAETGIYMNPYVRVTYEEPFFQWLGVDKLWERLLSPVRVFLSWFTQEVQHPWRMVQEGERFKEEIWDGDAWKLVDRVGRNGLFCGVREMQILRKKGSLKPGMKLANNWINTRYPPGQTLDFRSWWGKELHRNWKEEYAATEEGERESFFQLDY